MFVGRLPTLAKRIKKFGSVEDYVDQVVQKKQRDPVLSFQLSNDFEVIGVIPHYLDADAESLGYGIHLVWHSPKVEQDQLTGREKRYGGRPPDAIRVGTVQNLRDRRHDLYSIQWRGK